jgi:hypothetical protein
MKYSMSANMRKSESRTELRELAEELIEAGAVALTAGEMLDGDKLLILSVHGPYLPNERNPINSICEDIDRVYVDEHEFYFDFVCDPYPPTPYGKVGIYVPERFTGDDNDDLSFSEITLDEGVERLKDGL